MFRKIKSVLTEIRQMRQVMEQLKVKQEESDRLANELYWAHIFESAIKGSVWFNNVPLNVGRWAAGYPLFYILFRILNEVKPDTVLEFGMGESTRMIQSYKHQHNPKALCVTVEHDKKWIEIKKQNGLSEDYISVISPELETITINEKETLQYKELSNLLSGYGKQFKLILIDGPFGSSNYSRHNIVELIENGLLSDSFIILMDDYERSGEKETVEDVRKLLNKEGISFCEGFYSGKKDLLIIVSEDYKFLTSL